MKGRDTRYPCVACLAMLCLVAGCAGGDAAPDIDSPTAPAFGDCLARHLATHPGLAAQDVYKFIHQSVAGPGHLIPDDERALAYLQQEIADLEDGPLYEPLVEELGGELDLVRLNLRPYLRDGGDLRHLVQAMQVTAVSVTWNRGEMQRRLQIGAVLLAERGMRREREALLGMLEELADQGYPALHHSESYRAAYHPAYRVISRQQATGLGKLRIDR